MTRPPPQRSWTHFQSIIHVLHLAHTLKLHLTSCLPFTFTFTFTHHSFPPSFAHFKSPLPQSLFIYLSFCYGPHVCKRPQGGEPLHLTSVPLFEPSCLVLLYFFVLVSTLVVSQMWCWGLDSLCSRSSSSSLYPDTIGTVVRAKRQDKKWYSDSYALHYKEDAAARCLSVRAVD